MSKTLLFPHSHLSVYTLALLFFSGLHLDPEHSISIRAIVNVKSAELQLCLGAFAQRVRGLQLVRSWLGTVACVCNI